MDIAGRTVIALSGGVDSSVAAALLQEQGHDLVAVTLQLRPCDDKLTTRSCCGADGPTRARAVAGVLGIPHYLVDVRKEFEELILRPAWAAYTNGRTPSPCLWCNERIKFGFLMDWARDVGAGLVATGHYAQRVIGPNGPELRRAVDATKDQSYFLARLGRERLERVLFPLGGLEKSEVRTLASRLTLPTATTADSQDICMVEEGGSFPETLRKRYDAPVKSGTIVDAGGRELGKHNGTHLFTLGQRRGLGIEASQKTFVSRIDVTSGTVEVSHDERVLLHHDFTATDAIWLIDSPSAPITCSVQVRYRNIPTPAQATVMADGSVQVHLENPVRAVTPGQAAVFYDGDKVLGCAWIQNVAARHDSVHSVKPGVINESPPDAVTLSSIQ